MARNSLVTPFFPVQDCEVEMLLRTVILRQSVKWKEALTMYKPMTTPDTWYAYFHVKGSFDPDEITKRVGILPTRTQKEGDPIPRTSMKIKCSMWVLRSRLKRTEKIELHVKDVIDQLDANREEFTQLSRAHGGTIQVVGYFQEARPGIHFDEETVRRIARYFLSIQCDFYKS